MAPRTGHLLLLLMLLLIVLALLLLLLHLQLHVWGHNMRYAALERLLACCRLGVGGAVGQWAAIACWRGSCCSCSCSI